MRERFKCIWRLCMCYACTHKNNAFGCATRAHACEDVPRHPATPPRRNVEPTPIKVFTRSTETLPCHSLAAMFWPCCGGEKRFHIPLAHSHTFIRLRTAPKTARATPNTGYDELQYCIRYVSVISGVRDMHAKCVRSRACRMYVFMLFCWGVINFARVITVDMGNWPESGFSI